MATHDGYMYLQGEGYGSLPETGLDTSGLVSRLAMLPIAWPNDPPPLQGSGIPELPRQVEGGQTGGDREPEVGEVEGRWESGGSLGHHWKLEGQIGRGSFGEVWHASRFGPPARGVSSAQ
jgi:hypothetical protein